MINLINTSSSREIGESVLFQSVLKAYLTCHSWIITAHISLGHLECQWKYCSRQVDKTHQLLQTLSHQPAALIHLISPLPVVLTNINDIYDTCKPTIISAINLLNMDPSFDGHVNNNNHPHWTNSLKLTQHSRKPWYTLYPFLTSHDVQHK